MILNQQMDFSPANLFQNVPLVAQFPLVHGATRHRGLLYGSIPGKQLLIGGVQMAGFSIGDEISVQLLMEGSIFSFTTKIENEIGGPETIYLVSFPEEVEQVHIRKNGRMPVFIPVEITFSTDNDQEIRFVHGAFINISEGGGRFTARRIPRDISRCEVSFTLPGSTHKHLLECRVVGRETKNSLGSGLSFAFQTGGKSATVLGTVREWIAQNFQLASC